MHKKSIEQSKCKILLLLTIIFSHFSPTFAQENNPDAVNGIWQAEQLKIEVFKSGDFYVAKTITGSSILEADGKTYKKDLKNPDPQLRTKFLHNYVYITGLKFKKGQWINGKVYDFTSGKYYDVDLELKDGTMYMYAYLKMRMLGMKLKWTKAK